MRDLAITARHLAEKVGARPEPEQAERGKKRHQQHVLGLEPGPGQLHGADVRPGPVDVGYPAAVAQTVHLREEENQRSSKRT